MLTKQQAENLKVGDMVILPSVILKDIQEQYGVVSKITETQIVVGDRRFNKRGWERGQGRYGSLKLPESTP